MLKVKFYTTYATANEKALKRIVVELALRLDALEDALQYPPLPSAEVKREVGRVTNSRRSVGA